MKSLQTLKYETANRDMSRVDKKKHFVDPSLAIASLGATPGQLRGDLNVFGFMFENMVIRDLKIFSDDAISFNLVDKRKE